MDEVDRTVPSSDATLKFQNVTLNINDGQQITQKGVSGAYFATLNQGVGTFIYVDANGKDAETTVKLENVTFDGVTDAQFNGSYVTGGSEFLVYGSGENQKTYVEVVNSNLRLANITFGNYSNSSANAGSIEGLIKGTSE